jgi:hypothetical protein
MAAFGEDLVSMQVIAGFVMVAATCKSSFIYIKNKKSLFIL